MNGLLEFAYLVFNILEANQRADFLFCGLGVFIAFVIEHLGYRGNFFQENQRIVFLLVLSPKQAGQKLHLQAAWGNPLMTMDCNQILARGNATTLSELGLYVIRFAQLNSQITDGNPAIGRSHRIRVYHEAYLDDPRQRRHVDVG